MNCVICNQVIGRSKESINYHNKRYHNIDAITSFTVTEPFKEFRPMSANQYAVVQSRVERRLKDFIVEPEADKQMREYSNIEIPNYGHMDRPPQMTDAEIVMSIERLALRFYENVAILKKELGAVI